MGIINYIVQESVVPNYIAFFSACLLVFPFPAAIKQGTLVCFFGSFCTLVVRFMLSGAEGAQSVSTTNDLQSGIDSIMNATPYIVGIGFIYMMCFGIWKIFQSQDIESNTPMAPASNLESGKAEHSSRFPISNAEEERFFNDCRFNHESFTNDDNNGEDADSNDN